MGFVPARGGSKGLPGKNIKDLCGRPLIAWTIEQAINSKYFDLVLVSTDDDEIAEISKACGANVPFLRPAHLAIDTARTVDAIFHAEDYYKKRDIAFDYVVLLEPTSPLRKENDIDDAIKILIDDEARADSLVSLGEVHMEHPCITKVIESGYVSSLIKEKQQRAHQRQQLSKAYFPYGVIYASKFSTLRDKETFYQEKTIPYLIERWQNYEIDDLYDYICIEAIMKHLKRGAKK